MKIIDFYSGFEGETEINIYSSNIQLKIWNGYFEPIMNILFDLEIAYLGKTFGIVSQWNTCTNWAGDFEKTKIDDLDREIAIWHKVDLSKLDDKKYHYISDEWKEEIKKVFLAILALFENAKLKGETVYIEEY